MTINFIFDVGRRNVMRVTFNHRAVSAFALLVAIVLIPAGVFAENEADTQYTGELGKETFEIQMIKRVDEEIVVFVEGELFDNRKIQAEEIDPANVAPLLIKERIESPRNQVPDFTPKPQLERF
jgi:methyl coenzyme M reductase subunit C-like uncharacterized protein (methanogenesis marker protein 7)